MLSNQSDTWRAEWSATDTSAFVTKAKNAYGKDLMKMLEDEMTETNTVVAFASLTGTGQFLDEEELRAKYADKQQRLNGILKNARRIVCPVSEIEMIEDMAYQSTQGNNRKRTAERIVSCKTPAVIINKRKPRLQCW